MHISLYLQQLRRELPQNAEPAMDHLESEIEIARVQQMMESMSLLSQDPGSLTPEILHLDQWLRDLLPLYQEAAETLGCSFETRLDASSSIRASDSALRQIFSNLISNAFRYAVPASAIHVSVVQDGPLWVALSVANPSTPPTVDPLLLAQPFVRGANDREGTGLGLAVVENLCQAMGARFSCRYAEGIFSARVLLPRATPDSKTASVLATQ
ncbi:MAG: HAMP domain-containing histidine kinase [Firmicutes bacterium]|nr:HAMP domain-containing histidine kinase [Bacillota bacterium]